MRALDLHLGLLRAQKAQGANVDDAIAETLIAMVKDAYASGDIEIEQLESTVTAILEGRPIAILQPGEIVLRAGAVKPEGKNHA